MKTSSRPKNRPRDVNQLAKLIVDIATGEQAEQVAQPEPKKKPPRKAAEATDKRV